MIGPGDHHSGVDQVRSPETRFAHRERASRAGAQARRQRVIRRRRIAVLGVVATLLAGVALAIGWPDTKTPRNEATAENRGLGSVPRSAKQAVKSGSTAIVAKPPVATTVVAPPYEPAPITPIVHPALAGEGTWTAMDTWDQGPAAILTTAFRPDPAQPSVTAYVAWLRSSRTQLALYPGYKGPGTTPLNRGPEMVPLSARADLLATFNSGFYEADSAGGFYTHGTLYFPMINGLATVVAYRDGRIDIVAWTGGPTPGPDVVMARQNLPLIVNGGAPTPSVDVSFKWGVTLHGAPAVWRTALGIDRHGNLLYVAAPEQTAPSLAQVLVDVGAVRAMELDINPEWPIFVTYAQPGASGPALFVPNPNQTPQRFLYSSTKDFFAVYVGSGSAKTPPW
jgi:hypothetical protein